MNRIGLKIGSVLVAIVIWIQVTSTAVVEQRADLPLVVTGLKEGTTVAGSDLPPTVGVRLRGSKLRLLAHRYLHRNIGEVRLDLSDRNTGRTFLYQIEESDVITALDFVAVSPLSRLKIRLDELVTRRMPVEVATNGSLREGVGFVSAPIIDPDSVTVSGPARFFEKGMSVTTVPVDLARLESPVTQSLGLVAPHEYLQIMSREASVTFQVGILMDRALANVPVVALLDDGQAEVGLSPPIADVLVRGLADSVRTMDAARFVVTVTAGGLARGVHVVPGRVEMPAWVKVLGVDPSEFKVIVGDEAAPSGMNRNRGPGG